MNTLLAPKAPPSQPPTAWALTSLSLVMLLPSLGTSIANIALPTLTQEFGASFQQVQWVVLSFLLATTTLVVSAGRLGDVLGRRRLLMAGVALFTAASAVGAAAPNLWVLIAARAVQGIGAAAMLALTVAFVGQTVPKERTGSAMGLLGTMSAVGTALGPSIGGLLIAGFGWQAIFLINIPLGIVAIALAKRHLPADGAGGISAPLDHLGTFTLAMTLAAPSIRMQAPVPGRSYVGIEVPNPEVSVVGLREVIEQAALAHFVAAAPDALVAGQAAALEAVRAAYAGTGIDATLDSFFADVPDRLRDAHLVIARSGASTVAELTALGRPAILVPYPHAIDDHQTANARAVDEAGGAWLMPQPAFTPDALAARLEALFTQPGTLARAAERARAAGRPDAAALLADLVAALPGQSESVQ